MKAAIREQIKQQRAQLQDVEAKSKHIKETLQTLPIFQNAKNILIYVSINNEVATHELIEEGLKTKNVFIPFVQDNQIKYAQIKEVNFEPGPFGVLEPKEKRPSQEPLDIIIVPGVAFDREKARIGYGKGYYDMFLTTTQAKKIALAFDMQIVEHIETEPHDIKMDMIITETEVIQ